MTPNQYRTALEALGLTQLSAAQFLGVSVRTSHSYANGRPIPVAVGKLLRLMLRLDLTAEDVDQHNSAQQLHKNYIEGKIDR